MQSAHRLHVGFYILSGVLDVPRVIRRDSQQSSRRQLGSRSQLLRSRRAYQVLSRNAKFQDVAAVQHFGGEQ